MVLVHPDWRVCMVSVWLAVFVVLGTGAFTHGKDICWQCPETEQKETRFCNKTVNLQQCHNATDICYTKVTKVDGTLFSAKGCITPQLCHQSAEQNDEHCAQGVALSNCTYCCNGTSCNHDKFEYMSKIPTTTVHPTTPTTPTTTTPSLRSTLGPSACKSENLTRCTTEYEKAFSGAIKSPRNNFRYFCRQVPVMFQCIAEAMASCSPDNQLALHDQLKSVSEVMWSQCARQCNVSKAQACTTETITKVISKVIDGSGNCETLRMIVVEHQKCLAINIGTCSDAQRIGFEDTAKVIKSAVEGLCKAPALATTMKALPTGRPGCKPKIVEQCLIDLGEEITKSGGPDYDVICWILLTDTETCFLEHSANCSVPMKERLQLASNFTHQLMMKECTRPTLPPLPCDEDAAWTCALEIVRVFEKDKRQACSMVEETVQCVVANTTGCTDKVKKSLNRMLNIAIKGLEAPGFCKDAVEMEGECANVQLHEGGTEWQVRFHSNYDPKRLCDGKDGCKVYVQAVIADTASPKCQNGDPIPQIMCRPEQNPISGPACGVLITSENWKKTHTINLAATLDNKVDGNKTVEVKLQYTKVIKGKVVNITTLETCHVTVIDHDKGGQCYSLNGPQMKTFDGVYFNNFLEGVFVLYRHTKLPYEVQVLYQKCGSVATCTCGVTVKSGDSVFFVDKCKRKNSSCQAGRECKNLLKAKSYAAKKVTDGTRLFIRPDGYMILLPHGTRIKIQDQSGLNVWITPSAADYSRTTGLCGMYDGSTAKDLVLPNGKPYTGHDVGPSNHSNAFSKEWRVTNQSLMIHRGVPTKPYSPPQYCVCKDHTCHKVDCSAKHLVSSCDMNTAGERTLPTIKPTVEKKTMENETDIDFDLHFEPKKIDLNTRNWTEEAAKAFCQGYIGNSSVVTLCTHHANVSITPYVAICIQDILLTNGTQWAISALEGVKAACLNILNSDPKFADSDNKHIVAEIAKARCPLECLDHGTCHEGKCKCGDNYAGETCNVKANAVPSHLLLDNNGHCNTRKTNCSRIVVYADDLIKTGSLTCHLTAVKVTEAGVSNTTNSIKIKAEYVSSNQVICGLHWATLTLGYNIDLSNDGQQVSQKPLLYMIHDPSDPSVTSVPSAPSDSSVSSEPSDSGDLHTTTCTGKAGTCAVEGKCYLSGETDPHDACSVCDPATSNTTLRHDKGLACRGSSVWIIISVVPIFILSAFAIWYYRRQRRNQMKEDVENKLIQRNEHYTEKNNALERKRTSSEMD